MKLFARPKNLCEAMAPIITLNHLVGLRAFEYPRGQRRPIFSLIYLLFLYCLYYVGSTYLLDEYYANLRLLKLENVLYNIFEMIIIYLVFVKLLLGWWYTKKFEACYRTIFEIDETLQQLGSTINYAKMYFMIIGVMIVWSICNFSICTVVFFITLVQSNVYSTIGTTVSYFYVLSVDTIIVLEFCILVRCLRMRFELINKLLHESLSVLSAKKIKLGFFEVKDYVKIMNVERQKCLFPTKILSRCEQKQLQVKPRNRSQRHNSVMTESQKHMYLLQVTKQVHLELCKVSKNVCFLFGIQTACEIGIMILFFTVYFYNFYVRYIVQQHEVTNNVTQQTAVTIILSIINILKIISLCRLCKTAANEAIYFSYYYFNRGI
ncbi:uncharacterized protein LOC114931937 [Nylanderia fulva]|uniref:uncharacterized protein LOC114931937 n=1 Tax=Nylanderia fulva TaxID=613905 RepID=UPI0010FB493E|nr:uncharacterized protein LOC114931937 [Nylanderia fulva]